jgi:hypothetical protein
MKPMRVLPNTVARGIDDFYPFWGLKIESKENGRPWVKGEGKPL